MLSSSHQSIWYYPNVLFIWRVDLYRVGFWGRPLEPTILLSSGGEITTGENLVWTNVTAWLCSVTTEVREGSWKIASPRKIVSPSVTVRVQMMAHRRLERLERLEGLQQRKSERLENDLIKNGGKEKNKGSSCWEVWDTAELMKNKRSWVRFLARASWKISKLWAGAVAT